MTYEKVVTVYDTMAHADKAVAILKAAGYGADDISILNRSTLTAQDAHDLDVREPSLWRRLFGTNVHDHEATVYGRAIEGGGVVVSVRVPDSEVPRVMGILDVHNPVDVLQRAATVGAVPSALVAKVATAAPVAATTAAAKAVVAAAVPNKEDVIRLAEEQLNVGKKLVEEGTTRIRRFVTERPVEAAVTLHEEHAEVLRRAVTDPASIGEIDWSDKTIEVIETAERAVVSKTSRIAEEVVVRKEGSDHTETIKDTVRRQQVEVERLKTDTVKKAAG
jgi:uncharacterized protein (TIGR02271 family)